MKTTLCYIEKDGKYLMLHRVKKKKDINAEKWIGVGGKFEAGEGAEECLLREVWEETGLTLTKYEEVGLVKFISDIYEEEDMYLFKGLEFTGELREDCPEGELLFVDKEKVLSLPTWEGDRYFLEALMQGRKNILMTVRYEKDRLAEFRDDTKEVEILTSGKLTSKHGFSTRIGGVSEGIFYGLNLGFNRGDEEERVAENWRRFFQACGIREQRVVCGRQVHGNRVSVVGRKDAQPFWGRQELMEADGFVTGKKGVALAVFTADCVPVLLEDAKNAVIGAVHCGWRSTVADIEKEVIEKMVDLGAGVESISLAIGPSIGACHFEVGREVIEAAENLLHENIERFYKCTGEKYLLDLRGIVRERFLQLGILPDHIETKTECTMCEETRFWSHRATQGERGSMASVICMQEEEDSIIM